MPGQTPLDETAFRAAYEAVGLPIDCRRDFAERGPLGILDAMVVKLRDKGQKVLQRFENNGNAPSLPEAFEAHILPRNRAGFLNAGTAFFKRHSDTQTLAQKPVDDLSPKDMMKISLAKGIGDRTILEIAALSFIFAALKRQRPQKTPKTTPLSVVLNRLSGHKDIKAGP